MFQSRDPNMAFAYADRGSALARNCCLLGRDRYWGDSVSELFGFGLEALDL